MTAIAGKVVSVHVGAVDTLSKELRSSIEVALDGIVGDRHRGLSRQCWDGDKQAEGVVRRNERQWSAVSMEEVGAIQEAMSLAEPLLASSLGANLCLQGIPDLSRLARGTLLKFSSGVVLMVEEYNPPCSDMGEKLAQLHTSNSGEPIASTAFSQAAKFLRGVVGVVDVAGVISAGDEFTVELERLPKWLRSPQEP
jgi:MOSC domain-containing protein YiiM